LLRTLRFICAHPLCRDRRGAAVMRYVRWQLRCRLFKGPHDVPFTTRTRLRVSRGMTGATGNIYCGLHEFEDMAFLLHLLRPGDLFVDVGANIGSYTVLASGHAGATSISFEPVPHTFDVLQANVQLNYLASLVTLHQCGVGAEPGELRFTVGRDTENHVARADDDSQGTIAVKVQSLDAMLGDGVPLCMKIDVEGFEMNVLRGASRVLASSTLRAVLMELNGSGERYGFDDDALRAAMADAGFEAFEYEPFTRTLTPLGDRGKTSGNTLFLRDITFVRARLAEADAIELPWCRIDKAGASP